MSNIPLKSITFPGLGNKYTVNANPLALSTNDRTAIPEDSDMDNYTTIGNYKVTTTAIARTIANIPSQTAGSLFVMSGSESVRLYQIYFAQPTAGIRIFAREKLSNSAWTDWIELTYRYTFDNAPTDGSANPVTSDGIFDALAEKADAEGTSQNLVAGSAEAILSDSYTEDSVPYRFRQTPVNSKRMNEKIIGGTVAWNQWMPISSTPTATSDGITFTNNADGSWTLTGTPSSSNAFRNLNYTSGQNNCHLTANHVYYLSKGNASALAVGVRLYNTDGDPSVMSADAASRIFKVNNVGTQSYMRLQVSYLTDTNIGTITVKPQLFDLTQMLGSTIADYILALETATAGAGVALFRSLFGASYYPYNAGELISISGLSARKAVGFNQFNVATSVLGEGINTSTGAFNTNANAWRSDYIKCVPNEDYYVSGLTASVSSFVAYYDSNKAFISRATGVAVAFREFTTPQGCAYFAITQYATAQQTFTDGRSTVCVNVSDTTRNGQYESYDGHTYPLDSTLTLRGIPKLDSNNRLYFDGDRYASDGTVTRRYGIVDLGTFSTWSLTSAEEHIFRASLSTAKHIATTDMPNILCANYKTLTRYAFLNNSEDKSIAMYNPSASTNYIYIKDEVYSDVATFKAAMSGVMLVYELATATTETADPFINPQHCSANGTEEYISETVVPVGHETKYYKDIVSAIEGIPDAPSANGTYVLKCTVSDGVPTYSWATQ